MQEELIFVNKSVYDVCRKIEKEYYELVTKIDKLKAFIDSNSSAKLANKAILEDQLAAMQKYRECLAARFAFLTKGVEE